MKVTDKITITNECNMELMKRYPDNYFDLAIVDPPYGIDWMNQIQNPNTKKNWKKYQNKDWDKETPTKEYFDELFRVSKNQIVWGGNYMIENLYSSPCWILWDKMQEFTGAVFEMAWTSFTSPAKAFRMSRVEAYSKGKIHPTQKPRQLYNWILDNYANNGDCKECEDTGHVCEDYTNKDCDVKVCPKCKGQINKSKILDTHLGSGSIALACHDRGFELTACELDEDYYKAAIKRIQNHTDQQTIFDCGA